MIRALTVEICILKSLLRFLCTQRNNSKKKKKKKKEKDKGVICKKCLNIKYSLSGDLS